MLQKGAGRHKRRLQSQEEDEEVVNEPSPDTREPCPSPWQNSPFVSVPHIVWDPKMGDSIIDLVECPSFEAARKLGICKISFDNASSALPIMQPIVEDLEKIVKKYDVKPKSWIKQSMSPVDILNRVSRLTPFLVCLHG